MKLERRGKYAGVKIHLDEDECLEIISGTKTGAVSHHLALTFVGRLGKKLNKLHKDEPDLLKERTPDQIKAELIEEYKKAEAKLKAIADGKEWKGIEV